MGELYDGINIKYKIYKYLFDYKIINKVPSCYFEQW